MRSANVGNFGLLRSKCFLFTRKYYILHNERNPFNSPHKTFFPSVIWPSWGQYIFYWSLLAKIGTSRVLKARPVNQATNHIYLCVDPFGDMLTQNIWQYREH